MPHIHFGAYPLIIEWDYPFSWELIDLTPIRRQYLKIKDAYQDSIVLFRMGDFYETFDDDAHLVARELDITLTGRSLGKNLRVPMAGVPAHSLDSYLVRLVRKGHQVAICEQLSDPATSKGLVDRDVVRVVTPGTVFEDSLLDQQVNNYLASVSLDTELAGLAYADITTGEFAATEVPLVELPLELGRISPSEILVPDGAAGVDIPEGPWRLTSIDGWRIDFEQAAATLLSHLNARTLESFGCEELPRAVTAAGGLVEYLDRTRKSAKVQLNNLAVYSTRRYMALDARTRRNLELFEGGRGQERELSLLAAIDRTRTVHGGEAAPSLAGAATAGPRGGRKATGCRGLPVSGRDHSGRSCVGAFRGGRPGTNHRPGCGGVGGAPRVARPEVWTRGHTGAA